MTIIIASIVAFISTNIDDIFLLILFYGNKKIKDRNIILGQFLGITTLIIISLIGSLIGLVVNQKYIGVLGLIPIYLGIKALIAFFKQEDHDEENEIKTNSNSILTVAGTTIANGGDNIGIYIPLFAMLTLTDKVSMIVVFLFMTFVWCMLAKYFTNHPIIAKSVNKYGHIVTPSYWCS